MLKKKSLIAVGVVATLAASVAIGMATIPDSAKVIHGCYSNSSGELRVIDSPRASCKRGETALAWNQQGPPGVPGAPGAQGQQGERGPSDGYATEIDPVVLPVSPVIASVATLGSIPAGSYMVTAKTVVDITSDTAISRVDCWLDEEGHTGTAGGYDSSTVSVSGDHQDVLVMSTGITLASPGGFVVKCTASRGYATLYRTTITAVQVGRFTGLPSELVNDRNAPPAPSQGAVAPSSRGPLPKPPCDAEVLSPARLRMEDQTKVRSRSRGTEHVRPARPRGGPEEEEVGVCCPPCCPNGQLPRSGVKPKMTICRDTSDGPCRARTYDLGIKSPLLYQLS